MKVDTEKLVYWCQHQQAWQASGLSQRAYCQREGVAFSTFDYWRQKVRQQDDTIPALPPHKPLTPLTLVPVQLAATVKTNHIVLRSPSGWQITLPDTLGGDALAHVLRQLP